MRKLAWAALSFSAAVFPVPVPAARVVAPIRRGCNAPFSVRLVFCSGRLFGGGLYSPAWHLPPAFYGRRFMRMFS